MHARGGKEKGKKKLDCGDGWVVVMVMEVEYGLLNEWMNGRALFCSVLACFI